MEVKWIFSDKTYEVKEKIDNQTFFMQFQRFDSTQDAYYYNIRMGIYNKRKHIEANENEVRSTGLNPIKTISCAIKAFELLENAAIHSYGTSRRIVILCGWVDNRRRDAYYKFLSKRGYNYGYFEGNKYLMKIIDK